MLKCEECVLKSYGGVCKRGIWKEKVKQVKAEWPRIYDEIIVVRKGGARLVGRDADPELAVPALKTFDKERY